jgi:hypothetical protein
MKSSKYIDSHRQTQILTKSFVTALRTYLIQNIKCCEPVLNKLDKIGSSALLLNQNGKTRSVFRDNPCPYCKGLTFQKRL